MRLIAETRREKTKFPTPVPFHTAVALQPGQTSPGSSSPRLLMEMPIRNPLLKQMPTRRARSRHHDQPRHPIHRDHPSDRLGPPAAFILAGEPPPRLNRQTLPSHADLPLPPAKESHHTAATSPSCIATTQHPYHASF